MADAAQRDIAAFPMVAQAGCKSVCLEAQTPAVRDAFEMWAYASYLIAIEKPSGNTRLGLPAFYRNSTARYAHVHERYSWNIGRPTLTVDPSNMTAYVQQGTHTFVRPFTNGIVLVNPQPTADTQVALGGEYHDPTTGKIYTEVDMSEQSGQILLKTM